MSGKRKIGRPSKRGRSTSNNEVVVFGKRHRKASPKMEQQLKERNKNQAQKDKRRKQAPASKKKAKKISKITKISLKIFPLDQKAALQADPPTMDWRVAVVNIFFLFTQP